MRKICILFVAVLLYSSTAFAATVPQIASGIGREMDRQVIGRLGLEQGQSADIPLLITTPVSSDDLTQANSLARQMQEELARWFVQAGYVVQEVRKADGLMFSENTGELMLSRDSTKLSSSEIKSALVLTGTYTITPQNVRFNIRLVKTASQEVLAMSTATVPITAELRPLLRSEDAFAKGVAPIEPTVITRLP